MNHSRPYATVTLYSPIPYPTYSNGTETPYVPHEIDPRVSGMIAGLVLGALVLALALALACGCGCRCSSRDEKKKRRREEGGGEGAPARGKMDS